MAAAKQFPDFLIRLTEVGKRQRSDAEPAGAVRLIGKNGAGDGVFGAGLFVQDAGVTEVPVTGTVAVDRFGVDTVSRIS